MSAPSISELQNTLRELTKAGERIRSEYRWIHNAAHDRTVTDEAKVTTHNVSDPTGNLVGSTEKARQRRELSRCHERCLDALASLRAAETILRGAEERIPERIDFERRNPRTASRADLAGAREAKERRESRGEGWGSG